MKTREAPLLINNIKDNTPSMFLTKREISPYTSFDIIIGIFDTEETATRAKEKYIDQCNTFDKWAEQAYKDVNLETDVIVIDLVAKFNFDCDTSLKTVFVVSRFDEAFGQIVRTMECVLATEETAKEYCAQKNNDEELELSWAYYYDYELVELNRLYYDK
jgi:hypothetical protein